MFIAIDIGTTNLKTGLFNEKGKGMGIKVTQMNQVTDANGISYYEPEVLWNKVVKQIRQLIVDANVPSIQAISITSMAESGVLVNVNSGKTVTKIIPWFETASSKQALVIEQEIDPFEQFTRTGLHVSYKYGLCKLLWLKENKMEVFEGNVRWLSVSSFIAYRLTEQVAEEKSLAARTFTYDILQNDWNSDLIRNFYLSPDIFPEVVSCTTPIGRISDSLKIGVSSGAKVYIAGHDHLTAYLSIGEVASDHIYNSMGTAETLIGTFSERPLTKADAESGLTFGLHPYENTYFWMGGHSSSGGSVEWARTILADDILSYMEVNQLLGSENSGPTGILYFPYLTGSGAPYPDPNNAAAFIGLKKKHQKKDILKAIIEGNAFQMELIRDAAETITRTKFNKYTVVGGGIRNKYWIKLKSNISGLQLAVPDIDESALIGAVLVAATGEGYYKGLRDAARICGPSEVKYIKPDLEEYEKYRIIYAEQFMRLREVFYK